jgi:hypothetical protein
MFPSKFQNQGFVSGNVYKNSRVHMTTVCIDSRSRTNGTDNNFKTTFQRFSNVVNIKMVSAEVPNTLYAINANNNQLDIIVDAQPYNGIVVPVGSYNGTTLASTIQTVVRAAMIGLHSNEVVVTFDISTNYLTFAVQNGSTLTLLAATGANIATGIWKAIGFSALDILTIVNGSQRAQATLQLREDDSYIFIRLRDYGSMSSSDGEGDIFAKLVSDDVNKFKQIYTIDKSYSYSSPLHNLNEFEVILVRRDRTLYNLLDN